MAKHDELTIDQSINKVKEICDKIESGELDIDECINLYKEAQAISKDVRTKLEKADLEIKKLTPEPEISKEVFEDESIISGTKSGQTDEDINEVPF